MIEFLLAGANLPFTIALGLMLGIAALEGVSLLFGAALSDALENLAPDLDPPGVDGLDGPGVLSEVLDWLHVGKVPILILGVVFLTAFGLIGLTLQAVTSGVLSFLLPGWLAIIPTIVFTLPVVRASGGLLARIMPREETDAVSEESFVGRVATIVLGRATPGSPAQARLRDQHEHTHYVMVEPDEAGEMFESGSQVILVRREGAVFRARAGSGAALTNEFKTVDY